MLSPSESSPFSLYFLSDLAFPSPYLLLRNLPIFPKSLHQLRVLRNLHHPQKLLRAWSRSSQGSAMCDSTHHNIHVTPIPRAASSHVPQKWKTAESVHLQAEATWTASLSQQSDILHIRAMQDRPTGISPSAPKPWPKSWAITVSRVKVVVPSMTQVVMAFHKISPTSYGKVRVLSTNNIQAENGTHKTNEHIQRSPSPGKLQPLLVHLHIRRQQWNHSCVPGDSVTNAWLVNRFQSSVEVWVPQIPCRLFLQLFLFPAWTPSGPQGWSSENNPTDVRAFAPLKELAWSPQTPRRMCTSLSAQMNGGQQSSTAPRDHLLALAPSNRHFSQSSQYGFIFSRVQCRTAPLWPAKATQSPSTRGFLYGINLNSEMHAIMERLCLTSYPYFDRENMAGGDNPTPRNSWCRHSSVVARWSQAVVCVHAGCQNQNVPQASSLNF